MGIFSKDIIMDIFGKALTMGIFGEDITMDLFSKALTMGIFSKAIAMDIFARDIDGSKATTMDIPAMDAPDDGVPSDGSKATAMDAPDDGALEAPSLDGDAALDAPGVATTATTSNRESCTQTVGV